MTPSTQAHDAPLDQPQARHDHPLHGGPREEMDRDRESPAGPARRAPPGGATPRPSSAPLGPSGEEPPQLRLPRAPRSPAPCRSGAARAGRDRAPGHALPPPRHTTPAAADRSTVTTSPVSASSSSTTPPSASCRSPDGQQVHGHHVVAARRGSPQRLDVVGAVPAVRQHDEQRRTAQAGHRVRDQGRRRDHPGGLETRQRLEQDLAVMGPARRRCPDRLRRRRRIEADGVALLDQQGDERGGDDAGHLDLRGHAVTVSDRHRSAGVDDDQGLRLRGVDALTRVQPITPRRALPVDLARVVALPIEAARPTLQVRRRRAG